MSVVRSIHPFPARMAPDIAVSRLHDLPSASMVLDPMAGSGTVLRHAAEAGHHALGFDMDPLAALMARVWTTPVCTDFVRVLAKRLVQSARQPESGEPRPIWLESSETQAFVNYWFGDEQRRDLTRLAHHLWEMGQAAEGTPDASSVDCLRLAVSRIIVTKDRGASLARDVSHSRPHKVMENSDFEVLPAFLRAVDAVCRNLDSALPPGRVRVRLGDARGLDLPNETIDYVLTSPPYLNAIDYMRGHRLALVWLGHSIGSLRKIRSQSIGAERAPDAPLADPGRIEDVSRVMGEVQDLPARLRNMIARYAADLLLMLIEIGRVLRRGGRATFVVGNSCLRGVFVRNSEGLKACAAMAGLELLSECERDLPVQSRYLPPPTNGASALGRRMRTESVLEFLRPPAPATCPWPVAAREARPE